MNGVVEARPRIGGLALGVELDRATIQPAPEVDCLPDLVEPRFAVLPEDVLKALQAKHAKGRLGPVAADKAVWNRMAA